MKGLRLDIERCLRKARGGIGSRSRLLMWATSMRKEACPYYYTAMQALGAEKRRWEDGGVRGGGAGAADKGRGADGGVRGGRLGTADKGKCAEGVVRGGRVGTTENGK